jgi:hypothetical protein
MLMSEPMDRTTLRIFWSSETHRGVIKRLHGATTDGVVHDLGIWADSTEIKSGRQEHTIPYDSVEAAVKRITEKYLDFHIVSQPDVVAAFESQEVGNRAQ